MNNTYNPNNYKMNDIFLGSKSNNNLSFNKDFTKKNNYNLPKKDNNELIKCLKLKIQKQEIDLKFLNEKIKKLQNEIEKYNIPKNNNLDLEENKLNNNKSNLTQQEVIKIFI